MSRPTIYTCDTSPRTLREIGWIVSTSDSEGHQVSLAEGAASGSIPIVIDRPGARDQYPQRWVHPDVGDAAAAVLGTQPAEFSREQAAAIDHASQWSPDNIRPLWLDALDLRGR